MKQHLAMAALAVATVGNPRSNGQSCRVQLEWLDWDGAAAGVSGPFLLAPDDTLEFTTAVDPAFPTTYQLNVLRNRDTPFEGHGKVRSNCTRLKVDAQLFSNEISQPGQYEIDPISVVRTTGNVGD
jgi:hypothetical protein